MRKFIAAVATLAFVDTVLGFGMGFFGFTGESILYTLTVVNGTLIYNSKIS